MGKVSPVAVQQNVCVVLYVADENGGADFHLVVGQRVLHRKLGLVRGGRDQRLGVDIDRAVRRCCIRWLCSCNDNILPNGDIGVVCIGNDAYAGAKAKCRGLRRIVAARIGAFHFVFDVLDAAFAVTACRVLCLGVGRVHIGVFDCLGGVDGLFLAVYLILGFPGVAFVFLLLDVLIVRVVVPRFGVLALLRICWRFVAHRHFQPGDGVRRVDAHGSRRDRAIDCHVGAGVIVCHAYVGGDITRRPDSVHVDADIALRGRIDGHFTLRRG